MSHAANFLVKKLTTVRPDGSKLTVSERAILWYLADGHNEENGGIAWPALTELLRIAEGRCGLAPQLFLFPARVTRDGGWAWDGNKPMGETGLRKPFEEVCKAAGLEWFCWNGFRHTAITRLAERGVPIAVIKRRAGHVTNRMSEHYTHISEQAEQMYLERTMPDRKPPQRAQWQPAEAYEPFTPRAG